MFVTYIINIVVNNASRITILKQGIRKEFLRSDTVDCNKDKHRHARRARVMFL